MEVSAVMTDSEINPVEKMIVVRRNGPFAVQGGVPLVSKVQVVSEHGEPLTWKKVGVFPPRENYILCRCGQSKTMPFCDKSHIQIGFDGTETADELSTLERRKLFPGGVQFAVRHDDYLCMESGFCGTRWSTLEKMMLQTEDSSVRSQVIAMVERCPSGSLTYALIGEDEDIEPDLPQEIATTIDILSDGPVAGALWVTGYIPIRRADGRLLELRNRVTLCSCGRSKKKPLCDATHRKRIEKPSGRS
jgi:CDGSH-type Zn-finger protein